MDYVRQGPGVEGEKPEFIFGHVGSKESVECLGEVVWHTVDF